MRYRYIGVLLMGLPFCAMAQITLTQEANAPLLGTEFPVHRQATFVNPGPGGMGQNWDLTTLTSASSYTVYVEDPMGVAGTHLIRGDVDSMYYQVNSVGMFLVKEETMMSVPGIGTAAITVDYTGAGVHKLAWPATFGSTWDGPVFGTYILEGEAFQRSGTVTGSIDGEGIVSLPTGSHGVIRVHSLVATNENGTFSGVSVSGNRRLHTWSYYADWLKHPLLTITADSLFITSPLPASSHSGHAKWLDTLTVGVIEAIENNAAFGVWPTPAREVLNVTLPGERTGTTQGILRDVSGRVVREYSLSPNGNTTLDINGLPQGQYLLQVITPAGPLGVRKVVIH
jgi:hypothetical protein